MRPMRDPAPSRIAYRLNRLMLTPGVRIFLRIGLPVLVVLVIAAIWASDEVRRESLVATLQDTRRQIEERPEFMVRLMVVENASASVTEDVRSLLPIDFPVSSFDLDLDDIRTDVETLDAVASAAVRVRSGGVLEIGVEERRPAVVWRNDDRLILLDASGHRVADIARRNERSDLPLIAGEGADRAVAEAFVLLDVADPVVDRVRGLLRVGERRWDLVLDRNQRVLLPEQSARQALERVMALDAAQDLLARDIAIIDFRNPGRPVLQLTEAALETMLDGDIIEVKDTIR